MKRLRLPSGFANVRDFLLFLLGVVVVVVELTSSRTDTGLLVLGASLLGLPAFLPGAKS